MLIYNNNNNNNNNNVRYGNLHGYDGFKRYYS